CVSRLERAMTEPSLAELEARRRVLFERLAQVGDFRRGSVSENYRRCGKPNCACAAPGHPGHGPRYVWTRTTVGRKTRGRQLDRAEVDKVRAELARYQQFAKIADEIVEVNEAICEARPVGTAAAAAPPDTGGEKGGSTPRSRRRSPPR
ncbi:MAG: DUF6788 family protein, partial [Micromonosporaceae bacterium]